MRSILFILLTLTFCFSCNPSSKKEKSPETVYQEDDSKHGAKDCAHCGMPSQDYPQWKVRLESKSKQNYFCSPRCFFIHCQEQKIALKEGEAWVTDYYNTKEIDALAAYYVVGSRKTGPMGWDLVPFSNQEDAKAFSKDYHGKQILLFETISPEMLELVIKNKVE